LFSTQLPIITAALSKVKVIHFIETPLHDSDVNEHGKGPRQIKFTELARRFAPDLAATIE